MKEPMLMYTGSGATTAWGLIAPTTPSTFDGDDITRALNNLYDPCFIVHETNRVGVSSEAVVRAGESEDGCMPVVCYAAPTGPDSLGDQEFRRCYGVRYAYYAGSMANGISSKEMVVALGKAGILGSFGAGGLTTAEIEDAILGIQKELPNGPYLFNLIHNPHEPALEEATVDLYLKYGVRAIEASAYLDVIPSVVRYRVAGLELDEQGKVVARNKIIAKISRVEVATKFMEPPPARILKQLLEQKLITEQQAKLAGNIPLADDITAEADSGGHTDNRPLVTLLPTIIALRDDIQKTRNYDKRIRVGAGGGVSTPRSALAAFSMGAAYVTTGSVNQACVEAGASEHARKLLSQADMADVTMAPAADMFEMGVKLQVLKRGTMFPMRAQKLYELYTKYDSIDAIPHEERDKLEKQVFRSTLDVVWDETVSFFSTRDPQQIERAKDNPKRKMALVFRWYLGLSSRWSNTGATGREMDYQIWCGPSMGAFNAWVKNSYLADISNRKVVDVAVHIMRGAAFYHRINHLKSQGVAFTSSVDEYHPTEDVVGDELKRGS